MFVVYINEVWRRFMDDVCSSWMMFVVYINEVMWRRFMDDVCSVY